MPREMLLPGALVECTDGPLGTVEHVLCDDQTGEQTAIVVRHGRAEYLLYIPARHVVAASPWRAQLDVRYDEAQTAAIEWGKVPPDGEHICDAGGTEPTPYEEELLGRIPGSPPGGPSTG